MSRSQLGARSMFGVATECLSGFRAAVAQVLSEIGASHESAAELSRRLGIDRTLGWKLSRIAGDKDPLTIVGHLPGESGFAIFIGAAERSGVVQPTLERARSTYANVKRLIAENAEDRESFEMLLAGYQEPAASEAVMLGHRKAAFRANGFIWGVQARVHYSAAFIGLSDEPGMSSGARVYGFSDFQRMRPDLAWTIRRRRLVHELDGRPVVGVGSPQPIDPEDAADGSLLLSEFCSTPLPGIREVPTHDGDDIQIAEGPVGTQGAVTIMMGEKIRKVGPTARDPDNRYISLGNVLQTPCEVHVFDIFVARSLVEGPHPFTGALYGTLGGILTPQCGEHQRLPTAVHVVPLGRGVASARSRDVDRVPELARHVFAKLRWDEDEFLVFRTRIEYPPIPSEVVVRAELPE